MPAPVPVQSFRRVPFNQLWTTHDKLDIKAIYRRPRFTQDRYGDEVREVDEHGVPTWDITGPLPVRHHAKWSARGFEYVTLASWTDLRAAANLGTLIGPDGRGMGAVSDYVNHRTGGPWHAVMYLESSAESDRAEFLALKAQVEQYGAETVEAIRRQQDPSFALPPSLLPKKAPRVAAPVTKPEPA